MNKLFHSFSSGWYISMKSMSRIPTCCERAFVNIPSVFGVYKNQHNLTTAKIFTLRKLL